MSIVGFCDRVLEKHLVKTNEKSGSVSDRVFFEFFRRDFAPLTCVSPNSRFWRLYFWWYGYILPHTHTLYFYPTYNFSSRQLACCLSRVSLFFCYLCSCHELATVVSWFMTLCCSGVKIPCMGGWANQWRPSHNHKNSSLLWSTDSYIEAFCLQVQCRTRKENCQGQVGVMQETRRKNYRNSMSKRIV